MSGWLTACEHGCTCTPPRAHSSSALPIAERSQTLSASNCTGVMGAHEEPRAAPERAPGVVEACIYRMWSCMCPIMVVPSCTVGRLLSLFNALRRAFVCVCVCVFVGGEAQAHEARAFESLSSLSLSRRRGQASQFLYTDAALELRAHRPQPRCTRGVERPPPASALPNGSALTHTTTHDTASSPSYTPAAAD